MLTLVFSTWNRTNGLRCRCEIIGNSTIAGPFPKVIKIMLLGLFFNSFSHLCGFSQRNKPSCLKDARSITSFVFLAVEEYDVFLLNCFGLVVLVA